MRNSFAVLIALSFFSCGTDVHGIAAPSGSCPSHTAMLAVYDGFLETICGCAEASPVYSPPGSHLICTVTAGTQVMFYFTATSNKHQIASTGQPVFQTSPLSDPIDPMTMIREHTIKLDTPGTYAFHDTMIGALQGDIIVL